MYSVRVPYIAMALNETQSSEKSMEENVLVNSIRIPLD